MGATELEVSRQSAARVQTQLHAAEAELRSAQQRGGVLEAEAASLTGRLSDTSRKLSEASRKLSEKEEAAKEAESLKEAHVANLVSKLADCAQTERGLRETIGALEARVADAPTPTADERGAERERSAALERELAEKRQQLAAMASDAEAHMKLIGQLQDELRLNNGRSNQPPAGGGSTPGVETPTTESATGQPTHEVTDPTPSSIARAPRVAGGFSPLLSGALGNDETPPGRGSAKGSSTAPSPATGPPKGPTKKAGAVIGSLMMGARAIREGVREGVLEDAQMVKDGVKDVMQNLGQWKNKQKKKHESARQGGGQKQEEVE